MRLRSVRIEATDDPDWVLVEARTDERESIAALLHLRPLAPGIATIGIDADGRIGFALPSPVWSTPVHIPYQWAGVTQDVVPVMVRGRKHQGHGRRR